MCCHATWSWRKRCIVFFLSPLPPSNQHEASCELWLETDVAVKWFPISAVLANWRSVRRPNAVLITYEASRAKQGINGCDRTVFFSPSKLILITCRPKIKKTLRTLFIEFDLETASFPDISSCCTLSSPWRDAECNNHLQTTRPNLGQDTMLLQRLTITKTFSFSWLNNREKTCCEFIPLRAVSPPRSRGALLSFQTKLKKSTSRTSDIVVWQLKNDISRGDEENHECEFAGSV